MNINIHSTVSSNSIGYFNYMVANYEALTSVENSLKFFAYCLDARSARRLAGDSRVHAVIDLPFGRGSGGHAMAIERAISNSIPGEVNVIADTDVTLLLQDWDRRIVDAMLVKRSHGIIATRLEDVGGFSTGDMPYQQYKRKPSTTWMALSPFHDFSSLQVRPDKANFIEVTTQELSDLYNLPIGFFVVKDTGWQIPLYLHERNIPYLALDIVKPTSPQARVLKGTNSYHDEFQWDGVPFLAHQRGSMTHRFRIDPLSVDFYDACDQYLSRPAWSVHPTARDRVVARIQDVGRTAKWAAKKIVGPLIGRG